MATVDAIPLQDGPDPADPAHTVALAAMTNYIGAILAFPHLKDAHGASPKKWFHSMLDMLPLCGPEWNNPMGTSTPTSPGSPHNCLCSEVATLIDSEKFSDVVRGWVATGLPDIDDPTIKAPYEDAPLMLILESVVKIALTDKEASASTTLTKSGKGVRDCSLPPYDRITEYCKALEAVGRDVSNAHEIQIAISLNPNSHQSL